MNGRTDDGHDDAEGGYDVDEDAYDDDDVTAEYDTEEDELERNPNEGGKWTSLAIAVLGAWLLVAPWILAIEFTEAMGFNSVIVGVVLAILGGYNYYRRADERLGSVAAAALVALLGLWLLVSPWVFDVGVEDPAGWNFVVVGLIVAALGLYSASEARGRDVGATAVE